MGLISFHLKRLATPSLALVEKENILLLYFYLSIDGELAQAAILSILGPMPSRPDAFEQLSLLI